MDYFFPLNLWICVSTRTLSELIIISVAEEAQKRCENFSIETIDSWIISWMKELQHSTTTNDQLDRKVECLSCLDWVRASFKRFSKLDRRIIENAGNLPLALSCEFFCFSPLTKFPWSRTRIGGARSEVMPTRKVGKGHTVTQIDFSEEVKSLTLSWKNRALEASSCKL